MGDQRQVGAVDLGDVGVRGETKCYRVDQGRLAEYEGAVAQFYAADVVGAAVSLASLRRRASPARCRGPRR